MINLFRMKNSGMSYWDNKSGWTLNGLNLDLLLLLIGALSVHHRLLLRGSIIWSSRWHLTRRNLIISKGLQTCEELNELIKANIPIADLGHNCWEQQDDSKIVHKMEVVRASPDCRVPA